MTPHRNRAPLIKSNDGLPGRVLTLTWSPIKLNIRSPFQLFRRKITSALPLIGCSALPRRVNVRYQKMLSGEVAYRYSGRKMMKVVAKSKMVFVINWGGARAGGGQAKNQ